MGKQIALALAGVLVFSAMDPSGSGLAHAGELSVEGRIVDQAGQPLSQVPVLVEGQGQEGVAVTDHEGRFAFYNLAPGSYSVEPLYPGEVKRVDVQVQSGWNPWSADGEAVNVGDLHVE